MSENTQQTIIVKSEKNPGLAAGLAFFLGPIGLLYSTVIGSICMFFVNIVVGFLAFGFGLILTWPICCIWGYIAASNYNKKLHASV